MPRSTTAAITDESGESTKMTDLDYFSIEEIDDFDDEKLHLLILNRKTQKHEWHWVYRASLLEHGLRELAGYGLLEHIE
jgi:hypothetical protein